MARHSPVSLLVALAPLLAMLLASPAAASVTAAVRVTGEPPAAKASLQGTTATPGPGGQGDFAGLVDIGGRRLYLECQGTGSPTVVLEAGYGNRADVWSVDLLQPPGTRQMVFPAVARFTRVCAYDRPGTVGQANPGLSPTEPADRFVPSRSDPAPMPRTARDIVGDLHLLLRAASVPGSYVLVGHSLGGLTVRLYASLYPDEVGGLVLVDASQEDTEAQVRALLTPARWDQLERLQQAPLEGYPDYELVVRSVLPKLALC
jgi:pimeloyl-ACP methyl ester carboxylesterase